MNKLSFNLGNNPFSLLGWTLPNGRGSDECTK